MSSAVDTLNVWNAEERVLTLLGKVKESHLAATKTPLGFSELHDNIMQLERFILSFSQDPAGAATTFKALTPEEVAALNEAYSFWETRLEREFVQRLIKGEVRPSEFPFYERAGDLVRNELAMMANFKPHRILFIGSGPLPLSAIHLHLQTGVPVDCVARAGYVDITRQALVKCGLNNSVRIFEENEPGYDVSDYDLILVALLASPKKSILKSLRKGSRADCHILCRTSFGLVRLAYQETVERDRGGFHLNATLAPYSGQLASTCLIEPAGSAAVDVRLAWLKGVDPDTAAGILRLMNRTLEDETGIGFSGPIDDLIGSALMFQLNADVESGQRHVLVAYKDGVIVGQVILTPNPSPNHRHIVELTRATIHPSFRGGGLALRAFQEIARKCEELERDVICLDVRLGTYAAMWWQHFGFKQYGLLADYSRVGDERYQGLYLTQTTAQLKHSLNELVSAASKASADIQPSEPA